MTKILVRNISTNDLKISYLLEGEEHKTILKPNDFIISEQPMTVSVKMFYNRGFVFIESVDEEKIIQLMESRNKKSNDQKEGINIIKREISESLIIDEKDEKSEDKSASIFQGVIDAINKKNEVALESKPLKWSDEELKFLKKNYPKHGRSYCSEKLGRTPASVQAKIDMLGLKKNKKK